MTCHWEIVLPFLNLRSRLCAICCRYADWSNQVCPEIRSVFGYQDAKSLPAIEVDMLDLPALLILRAANIVLLRALQICRAP